MKFSFKYRLRDVTIQSHSEEKLGEQKERANLYLQLAGVIIVALDENGRITLINKKGYEILGYEPGELIGKNWFDMCIPADIRDQVKDVFNHLMRGEAEPVEFYENIVITKTGKEKVIAWSNAVLRDNEGNVIGTLSSGDDITESKIAEEKLKKSEENFRNIFNSIPMGLLLYELKGEDKLILRDFNSGAVKMLNTDISKLIGKTIEEAFPPLIETDIPQTYKKLAREGGTWKWEKVPYDYGDIKGIYEVVAFHISPGKMVTSFNEITERIKSEEKLKLSEKNLKLSRDALRKERDILDGFLKTSPAGIVMVDKEGNIEYANPASEKVLGLTKNGITSRTYNDPEWKITDYDGNPYPDEKLPFAIVSTTKQPVFDIRHAIVWPNMKRKLLSINAAPLFDKNKKFNGMIATVEDISDRIMQEKLLIESEEKFRKVAEQGFMGVLIFQGEVIEYANQTISKMIGYSLEEILCWKLKDLMEKIHPKDLDVITNTYNQNLEGEPIMQISSTFRVKHKKGFYKWIETYSERIEYKRKPATLTTVVNITDKKKAEKIILEENIRLKKLNKIKEELITRISHELRTPLTSITAANQLLLENYNQKCSPQILEILKITQNGIIRLNSLIENLLDTSKIDTKKLKLNKQVEDFSKIILNCVKEMELIAASRDLAINYEVKEQVLLNVDSIRIHQVITNLLSNAIKNTLPGGSIHVDVNTFTDVIELQIKDTGIGITTEEKEVLFEKFGKIERFGKKLNVDIEGIGLGLYISKQIVEMHGGTILYESEGRNKGTTFIVRLNKN